MQNFLAWKYFPIKSYQAEPGDYLFVGPPPTYSLKLFSKDTDLNKLKKNNFTPIGIVVTPGSHNVYGDCSVSCVSLVYAVKDNPNGSTTFTPIEFSANGQVDSYANQYPKGVIIKSPNNNEFKGFIERPGLPTTFLSEDSKHSLSIDGKGCYDNVKNESDNSLYGYSPSPYLADGQINQIWWYADEENKFSAQRDFNGKEYTTKILNEYNINNYTAIKASNEFYPNNAINTLNQWYVPASGEMCYCIVRLKEINDSIQNLINVFGNSYIAQLENRFSSSTILSDSHMRSFNLTVCVIGNIMKNALADSLRPFIRINNVVNKRKINIDWEGIYSITINNRIYYHWDNINTLYFPKGTNISYKIELKVDFEFKGDDIPIKTLTLNKNASINAKEYLSKITLNYINTDNIKINGKTYSFKNEILEDIYVQKGIKINYTTDNSEGEFIINEDHRYVPNDLGNIVNLSGSFVDNNEENYVNINEVKYSLNPNFNFTIDLGFNPVTSINFAPGLNSIEKFDIPYITSLNETFSYQSKLNNIEALSNLRTSRITNMDSTFIDTAIENASCLENWNTSKVKSMYKMFYNCNKLENPNFFLKWDLGSIENIEGMFRYCTSIKSINLDNFKFINKLNESRIFNDCDIVNASIRNVTLNEADLKYFFRGNSNIEYIDLSNNNINGISICEYMLIECGANRELTINVTGWNFLKDYKSFSKLFYHYGNQNAPNVNFIGLDSWNATNIGNLYMMCTGLPCANNILNISTWDLSKVINAYYTFAGSTFKILEINCLDLNSLYDHCEYMFPDTLTTITGEIKNIKYNIDFKRNKFDDETLEKIINALGEVEGKTLGLSKENYNKLTEEQLETITAKGWTIETP